MPPAKAVLPVLVAVVLVPFAFGACGGGDGGGEANGGGGGATGNAEAGAKVFADSGCGNCHTLAAANAKGTTAPNLDEAEPSADEVAEQVRNGGGGMPAFGDKLSDQQIADVAAYVSESAGG